MKLFQNKINAKSAIKPLVGRGLMGLLLLGGLGGSTLTSCSDFLDILPLNDVVLENYWTQKSDVTSVLNSCYESLESENSIQRMCVWGELRSENLVAGSGTGNEINDLLNENILPANSYTKWEVMYQTINRCNTLIHYAPSVQEKDPNYSYNQMMANVAEASFIRDLCYFYLIRTFRDIPMSFEPSIDDTKDYEVPPTPMKEALDIIAHDLDSIQDYAVKRYVDDSKMSNAKAADQARENSSRVTRVAIWALLADINLWRGQWDETIKYCDKIIEFKQQQYKDKLQNLGNINDMYEFSGIPLIRESVEGSADCGNAYTEIFGDNNSFESLFELYFSQSQGVMNTYVQRYFGSSSQSIGQFAALSKYRNDASAGKNQLFKKNDCRVYETMNDNKSAPKCAITKYVNSSISLNTTNIQDDEKSLKINPSRRSTANANWIIYRLTDVMLMKAEAQIMKGGEAEHESAFTLINAVNKRACNALTTATKDTLAYADYKGDQRKMETLLLNERNRELMFEGKRWFDLVRFALRDGKTERLSAEVATKHQINQNAIKIRLSRMDYIFFPYNREELKLNRYLKQNEAYGDTEDFQK